MNLLISLIALVSVSLPLHELGHYIAAKRNGWENIRLALCTWHHIPCAVAVKAENEYEIENKQQFYQAYRGITRFYAMGSLFSMLGTLLCSFFNIFNVTQTFALLAIFAVYMIYEIQSMKEENQ